jgi:chromosome segregation ATPase
MPCTLHSGWICRVCTPVLIALFVVGSGCSSDREPELKAELINTRAELLEQLGRMDRVKDALGDLESALEDARSGLHGIETAIHQLGVVRLQEVIDDVVSGASDIDSALASARDSVEAAQREVQ